MMDWIAGKLGYSKTSEVLGLQFDMLCLNRKILLLEQKLDTRDNNSTLERLLSELRDNYHKFVPDKDPTSYLRSDYTPKGE